jgi:hypothetical protein
MDQPAWMTAPPKPKWMDAPTGMQPPLPKFLVAPKPEAATGVTQPSPPEPRAAQPSALRTYVDEGVNQLARIPSEATGMATEGFKENTAEAFKAGQGNVTEGVAAMKRGDILKGATADVIGTIQEGASPLTGAALTAWNMLGMGDPMMAGVEAPHVAARVEGELPKPVESAASKVGSEAVSKALAPRPTVDDVKAFGDPAKPADFEKPKLVSDNVAPVPGAPKEPPKLEVVKPYADVVKALPAVKDGFVRFYHGGKDPTSGGGRWVTTDPVYARDWDGGSEPHYVDLPKDDPLVVKAQNWETGLEESYGPSQVGTYAHFETTPEQAKGFKPVLGVKPDLPAFLKPEGAGAIKIEPIGVFEHEGDMAGQWNVSTPDGNTVRIKGTKKGSNFDISTIDITDKDGNVLPANKLGPATLRQILREFSNKYPGIETVGGARVSGAREAAGAKDRNIQVPAGAAPSHPADILAGTIADREKAAVTPDLKQNLKDLASAIRSISSPDKATPEGARAGASIRSSIGRATRDSEKTKAALEGYQKQVAAYSPADKLDMIDSLQNWSDRRAQGYETLPEVAPLFNEVRRTFEDRKAKLMAAPSTERMNFINDYYPQMWKDPEKARAFAGQFGTKEGSGGFTKARTIPTVADGIRAGLEPVTIDPIEATFRYVENVDRFLATNEVFDTAVERGDVVWRNPKDKPAGWSEVNGRLSQKYPGQKAYAPEGWATVYNRFISRPPDGLAGKALEGLQKTANSITAFKLGVSGYHALNMVGESIRSGIANALDEAFYGNPIKAAAALGKAPGKWVTSAIRGKQMQKAYLHDVGSPELRKVVDLATEANFRVAGKGRIADEYRFTGQGSLLDAFRRGSLKAETQAAIKGIGVAPVSGTIKAIESGVGRTLETLSDPLFRTYIPAIKNGAFYDIVSTWLREHPEASHEEQVAFARKASDIVDNNFGEMNQDNIFWQKWTKQVAQSAFVSYSYTLGTARQVAGTAGDLARIGKDGWSNNLSQAVALPIMVGTLGAIYQYAKTRKPPESLRDLVAPQTGGTDATTGQPERAVMPSYLSQFLNGYMDPRQEATNKLNGLYELLHGAFTGTDWRGDPIAPSTAGAGEVLKNYLEMAAGTWQPISTENRGKVGTKIGGVERFSGVKAAPMFLTDPEGYAAMKRKQGARADKLKARHDATHERTYGGTQ